MKHKKSKYHILKRRFITFSLLMFVFHGALQSQENKTNLTGKIENSDTGEPVPFANIILEMDEVWHTTTSDSMGYFLFRNIPYGTYHLTISSVGFHNLKMVEVAIEHQNLPLLDIQLVPSLVAINEIVVKAEQLISQAARLSGGYTLTPEEVRRFPATFYDPARLATVYPGILNVNDQANNLAIRGSSPNQMNFFIEGAEIVNSNHLANAGTSTDRTTLSGGSVNMISAQLLENTEIYTGVIPVNKLQATSGAMDYHLKRGSLDQFHFTGQAGLNGIDLSVEGPLSDRISYVANYRYSTVGLLSQLGVDFSDETILYQDLALQLSFYQNERTKWQFFAMGGDNSNTFEAKVDSLREEYKDLFNIDFKSQIGIAGGNVQTQLSDRLAWNTTLVASTRWDQRNQFSPSISSSFSEDYLRLNKYSLNSEFVHDAKKDWQLHYGINTTLWSGGLRYKNEQLSEVQTTFSINSLIMRPYINSQWKVNSWQFTGGLGISYSELSGDLNVEPKGSIIRYLSDRQKLSFYSGLQYKLQPYQVILASDRHASLPLMQSWKSTLTYEQNFSNGTWKTTTFYERLSHIAASSQGFSALNILEEYPPSDLTANGKGQNFGLEASYQHFLDHGLFYMLSGTLFNAQYKTPYSSEWINSHFNNRYILNGTIGKEFDFSNEIKQKVLGINFQLVYTGGFWETPIDITASRMAQQTIRSDNDPFTQQLADVLKTYFRIYYKINHSKRYSLVGLDLSNMLNRNNVAYRYYDPFLDEVVDKYQLGLIPMLSYVIRI